MYMYIFDVVILEYMLLNYSNDAAVVCIIKILKEQNITQKDPVKCNHLISLSSYSKTIRKINTNKLVYTLYLKSISWDMLFEGSAEISCLVNVSSRYSSLLEISAAAMSTTWLSILHFLFWTLILKHICRRELKCCHAVMACLFLSKGI